MFTQVKNILIISALASSLAACSRTDQTTGMSGMKMNPAMCKEMMEKKGCDCCKMMQNQESMRTSGMMTGSGMKPMMCMPTQQAEKKTPVKKAAPKASPKADEAEHKAHHPDNAQ